MYGMKDPHHYPETIQRNVEKMRAQGQVTPVENALFGMLDGLAGLTLQSMERLAVCEQRLRDLEAAAGITPNLTLPAVERPAAPQ
jgi:hypothetical protein